MAGEITELTNLLIKSGYTQENIHREIVSKIQEDYTLWTHQQQHVDVIFDYETESIHLYKDQTDVTPEGFSPVALKSIRKYLIQLLSGTSSQKQQAYPQPQQTETAAKTINIFPLRWFIQLIFWFYNGIYLIYLLIILSSFLEDGDQTSLFKLISELHPFKIFTFLTVLVSPLIALFVAIYKKLYRDSAKIFNLFFLFEVPIIVICLFATFNLDQVLTFVWLIFLIIFILSLRGLLTTLGYQNSGKYLILLKFIFNITLLMITGYISLILLFFLPLLINSAFYSLIVNFQMFMQSYDHLFSIFTSIVGLTIKTLFQIFIILFIAILVLLPYFVSYKTYNKLKKQLIQLNKYFKVITIRLTTVAVIILFFIILFFDSFQFRTEKLLSSLENITNQTNFEARQQNAIQLQDKDKILEKTIKDAFRDSSRFIFKKDSEQLAEAYADSFGGQKELYRFLQDLFMVVVYPFTYHGPEIKDRNQIADNFFYLYGRNILDSQIKNQTSAVNLLDRQISAKTVEQGLFSSITITEEFQNTTTLNQEVIYEFTLPQNSVLTALKLGPNLEYSGQIAPKGASQRVYQQQVIRYQDPALLEQTGPRQYRLRVFPVPPKSIADNSRLQPIQNQPNLKVQFTYLVPLDEHGYSLPVYTLVRNIDMGKARLTASLDNAPVAINSDSTKIPVNNALELLCGSKLSPLHLSSATFSATLSLNKAACFSYLPDLKNSKIAILFDVSSNRKQTKQWATLKRFVAEQQKFIKSNHIDLYYFNDLISEPTPLANGKLPDSPVYFGITLSKDYQIKLNPEYDAIIILTDQKFSFATTYGTLIQFTSPNITGTHPPLYFVVEENKIPAFTQSLFQEFLKNNYHLSDGLEAAFYDLNYATTASDHSATLSFNKFWQIDINTPQNSGDQIDNLNLKQIITGADLINKIKSYNGSVTNDLTVADVYYQQARGAGIVSFFSSYIALVNSTQQVELNYDSQRFDRYNAFETPQRSVVLPTNSTYGFSSPGLSSGVNLIIFANLLLIAVVGVFYFFRYIRQRDKTNP